MDRDQTTPDNVTSLLSRNGSIRPPAPEKTVDRSHQASVSPLVPLTAFISLGARIRTLTAFIYSTQNSDVGALITRIKLSLWKEQQAQLDTFKQELDAFTALVGRYDAHEVPKDMQNALQKANALVQRLPGIASLKHWRIDEQSGQVVERPEGQYFSAFAVAKHAVYDVAQVLRLSPIPETLRPPLPTSLRPAQPSQPPASAETPPLVVPIPVERAGRVTHISDKKKDATPSVTLLSECLTFERQLGNLARNLGRLVQVSKTADAAGLMEASNLALRINMQLGTLLMKDWPDDARLYPLKAELMGVQDTVQLILAQEDGARGIEEKDVGRLSKAQTSLRAALGMLQSSPSTPGHSH